MMCCILTCLSFIKMTLNLPSHWTSSAVLETMLKLLPRSQLKIRMMYDNNEDVKCGFVQHLENTPEIKFECQEDKQLHVSNVLELYFKIFKVPTIFFPSNFHSD